MGEQAGRMLVASSTLSERKTPTVKAGMRKSIRTTPLQVQADDQRAGD